MSEYMSPIRTPFDMRRKKKPKVSDMSGRPFHVLDPDPRLDARLSAVLVRDGGGQVHLAQARVEGVDDRRVFLGHVPAPHLAGARHLGVVGLQVLGQEEEAPDLRGIRERLVALPDLLGDELAHLGLLGQVHVARVGQPPPLGPVAHRVEVDGDHRGHEVALMAEGDGLADERAVLELVLEELRGKGRAVGERPHVLGAVDDDEVPARIDEAGVPGMEPAVGVDDLPGRLLVLEVAPEHGAAAHEHLTTVCDLDLDARDGSPGRGRIRLVVRLERHEAGGLGGAVDLLEVDADGAEEPEGVGPERRTPGERPRGLAKAELVADGTVDEELAEGRGEAKARRDGFAVGAEDLGPLGRSAEILEGPALEGRGVGGPDLDRREHVFPDARWSQDGRGPQLPEIALDGLGALGAIGAESDDQAGEERVHGVARPRHGEIGERRVLRGQPCLPAKALRHADGVGVGQHVALGVAGGAGRVADDDDVLGLALVDLGLEVAGMLDSELPPRLLDILIGLEPLVLGPAPDPRPRSRSPRRGSRRRRAPWRWSPGRRARARRPGIARRPAPSTGAAGCRRSRRAGRRGRTRERPGPARSPAPAPRTRATSRTARSRGPSRGWPDGLPDPVRCAGASAEASSGQPRVPPLVTPLVSPRYALMTWGFERTLSGVPSAIFCPMSSTATRSEMSITTPMSCSIKMMVVPHSWLTSSTKRAMSSFSSWLQPPMGSSRSRTLGSRARARPSSTRFCSP